jgi:hypothetical protein
MQGLMEVNKLYKDDPYAKEFVISVDDRMLQIFGR